MGKSVAQRSVWNRRNFLTQSAGISGLAWLAGGLKTAQAQTGAMPGLKSRVGIELYTVRDLMMTDFEGVLAKLAKIGFREIEPANGYNDMEPKPFRAMLDRYGLTMPSTHSPARGTGADLERQLEGFQIMGIKYTEIAANRAGGSGAGRGPDGAPLPPGAYYNTATGVVSNSFTELGAFGPNQPRLAIDSVKKRAAALNANGKLARKFGMKTFVHNHTGEFERLLDSDKTEYDVLLEETDPELVTMQIDIAWAFIAGKDPVEMFKKNPGRYELWHVKDVFGLKTVDPKLSPYQRTSSMAFGPIGTGQIDYKRVFASAKLAGLQHFCLEQDNAASWGDSLAAARVSYEGLAAIL
jgi:sugar phosphate isomerase/epimerase